MAYLSPKFPLHFSAFGGYESNLTIKDIVKQNLKNLVLTSPGERIMLPDFGVGLKNFLFEQNVDTTLASIIQRMNQQIEFYMPFVELQEVTPSYEENQLIINIKYFIIPISAVDILSVRT